MQIISRRDFPMKTTKRAFIERFQDLLIGRCVVHGDPIEWTIYEIGFSNAINHQPWRTQIDSNWVRKEHAKAHSTVSNGATIQWRCDCILCTVFSAQALMTRHMGSIRVQEPCELVILIFVLHRSHQLFSKWEKKNFLAASLIHEYTCKVVAFLMLMMM